MRILIVSDTHGLVEPVLAFIEESSSRFDEIWHLGDFYKDAAKIHKKTGIHVQAVKGNCDMISHVSEDLILEIHGKRILLTHGHVYNVKNSMLRLHFRAIEAKIDIVCFGHTHTVAYETESGITYFNPGSASTPRQGNPQTVGILEVYEDHFELKIVPINMNKL